MAPSPDRAVTAQEPRRHKPVPGERIPVRRLRSGDEPGDTAKNFFKRALEAAPAKTIYAPPDAKSRSGRT